MFNLSSYRLTGDDISILCKGLKFCPTPEKFNFIEDKQDIDNFCRKLKLSEYFYDVEYSDHSLIKSKSSFNPPDGRNDYLDKIVSLLKQKPQPVNKNKNNLNISSEERLAVNRLKSNNNIIIKEADKGSAVVIMDTEYYEDNTEDIIMNNTAYEKLSKNIDKQVMRKISKLVDNFKSELTVKEIKYLTKFEYKTSNFYGLPKIHKSYLIKSAMEKQKNANYKSFKANGSKTTTNSSGPHVPHP